MSHNKLLSLLGIARKAGKLSLGNAPALEAMQLSQTHLILVANDLSPRTLKGISYKAEEERIEVFTIAHNMDEIAAALGKRTGIIAVNDAGFAKKLRVLYGKADMEQRNEEEMS